MTNKIIYTGWLKWYPSLDAQSLFSVDAHRGMTLDKILEDAQGNKEFDILKTLKENEYLLVYLPNKDGEPELCEQFCYEHGTFRRVGRESIKAYKIAKPSRVQDRRGKKDKDRKEKKSAEDMNSESAKYQRQTSVINPRNDEQICAFDLMLDDNKTVKALLGTWGAGKDLIMAHAALEKIHTGAYEQIVWIRNPVRLRDTPDLGALPGTEVDKLLPYLGPFIDATSKETVKTMLSNETLVVEPLQSLRGRNFENSILICSEAENLTYDHLKLIISRVADGSCLYINGDLRQRDKDTFSQSRGLEKFLKCLAGDPLFGYVFLPKTERSKTAALADKLDLYEEPGHQDHTLVAGEKEKDDKDNN